MVIDELFDKLRENVDGKQSVSYGKAMPVTEEQTKVLVALSLLLPNRLTSAIELIEDGKCRVFVHGDLSTVSVDGYVTSQKLWSCSCDDFLRQVISEHNPANRWQRVCKHLIAAYIIEAQLPILDFSTVQKKELSLDDLIESNLYGRLQNADVS